MSAGDWLEMTLLILVGLVPFAALGIAIGHMLTPDSIGPAMGGGVALLAFLGGTWFPIPAMASCMTSASYCPPTGWCRRVTSRLAGIRGRPRRGS